MRVHWAKLDGKSDDPKLAEAETALATDALQAERRADVVKGLSAVADLELRLQKAAPNAKPAIDVEALGTAAW